MRKGRLVMLKTNAEIAGEDLTELYIQYMEEQPAETGEKASEAAA
jgi:hypothetical protein